MLWVVSLNLILMASLATPVAAQVVISEVYATPSSGEPEWFELHNQGSTTVSLAGWSVTDQVSTPSTIYSFADSGAVTLTAGEYKAFSLSSSKLNNSADGVTLIDESGSEIDTMSYSEPSSSSLSWSLFNTGWLLAEPSPNQANLQPSPSPTPSLPPSPSPSPTPLASPSPSLTPSPSSSDDEALLISHLKLSEVMSCSTTGTKEWVELYWESDHSTTLNGWVLADKTSIFHTFHNFVLPAQDYIVVELPSAKLNNGGDSIQLLSPTGKMVWSYTIPECQLGTSFIVKGALLQLSSKPSPGEENIFDLTYEPLESTTSAATENLAIESGSFTTATENREPTSSSSAKEAPQFSYPGILPSLGPRILGATHENPPTSPIPPPLPKDHKWPIISVILGGSTLMLPNGLHLYLYAQKKGFFQSSAEFT